MAKPVDLTRPIAIAGDKVLQDIISTYRDSEGTGDDVYDPVTLEYTDPPGDTVVVLSSVRAKLRHKVREGFRELAGQPWAISEYILSVDGDTPEPPSGPLFAPGDWITVEASTWDPGLVGVTMRVVEEIHGTLKVFRQCRVSARVEGPL